MHPYFNRRYTPLGDPDSFRLALAQWQGNETIGFLMACARTRVLVLGEISGHRGGAKVYHQGSLTA